MITKEKVRVVTFSDDELSKAVVARCNDSIHFLTWYPRLRRGPVFRDEDRIPLCRDLPEHLFHILTSDFFSLNKEQRQII